MSESTSSLQFPLDDFGENQGEESDNRDGEGEEMRMSNVPERPEEFVERIVDCSGDLAKSQQRRELRDEDDDCDGGDETTQQRSREDSIEEAQS